MVLSLFAGTQTNVQKKVPPRIAALHHVMGPKHAGIPNGHHVYMVNASLVISW